MAINNIVWYNELNIFCKWCHCRVMNNWNLACKLKTLYKRHGAGNDFEKDVEKRKIKWISMKS